MGSKKKKLPTPYKMEGMKLPSKSQKEKRKGRSRVYDKFMGNRRLGKFL